MKKKRYFIMIAHCLINPATRVHVLSKNFTFAKELCDYLLENHISILVLPCAEFLAMGYQRNPQGRQQYDNVLFKEHCKTILTPYLLEAKELLANSYELIGFVGIKGSPTCSICWGKHKLNRYHTESILPINEDDSSTQTATDYGVMTKVLSDLLSEAGIHLNCFEVPVKSALYSNESYAFFDSLDAAMNKQEKFYHSNTMRKRQEANASSSS